MDKSRKRLRTDTDGRRTAGKKLRQAREAAGLSADEAAAKLHVSGTMVNLWEVGRSFPSMEHLRDLLVLYGASADWLLGNLPQELNNDEEMQLLGWYRRLPPIYQRGIREALRAMLCSGDDSDEGAELAS